MKRLVLFFVGVLGVLSLTLFTQGEKAVAQETLTATTKYQTALFTGPGNISCYSSIVQLPGNETLTLLARAPGVCSPYPGHYYFYVRRADGTEGWAFDAVLNLPPGAENLPPMNPPATNTLPPPLTATTKYATAFFSGPGNITCYNNAGGLGGGVTLTLLGRAPKVCGPTSVAYYYYARNAAGVEGWVADVVLNLPPGASSLPLMTPPPTSTPVGTPVGLTATTKYATTFFSGPGNITCYNSAGGLGGSVTLTLLGRAPKVCGPTSVAYYYYARNAAGVEGWVADVVLNLPPGASSLPLMTPRPANTSTPTMTPEPPTNTPEPPTFTPEPPTATPEPPTATPEPPTVTPEPPTETPTE